MFNLNSSVNQKMISDGLASTIMVGEAGVMEAQLIASPLHGFKFESVPGTTVVDQYTRLQQAWAQSFVGLGGKPGYGSVFAATSFDQWYDAKGKPAKEGPSPGFTPIRLGLTTARALRSASIKPKFVDHASQALQVDAKRPWAKPTVLDSNFVSMTGFSLTPRRPGAIPDGGWFGPHTERQV